jgi:hypothetical protein
MIHWLWIPVTVLITYIIATVVDMLIVVAFAKMIRQEQKKSVEEDAK